MGLRDAFRSGGDRTAADLTTRAGDANLGDAATPEDPSLRELIADGLRGRPDVDLSDYAEARGLSHRGNNNLLGYLAAQPMSEDLQFNVLRGTLRGGEEGMIFHRVELLDSRGAGGVFYGKRSSSAPLEGAGDLLARLTVKASSSMFKVPHTVAAVCVPELQGQLVGMVLGRSRDGIVMGGDQKAIRSIGGDGSLTSGPRHWIGDDPSEIGHKEWHLAYRGRGDKDLVDRITTGPISDLLAVEQPPRMRLRFRFGSCGSPNSNSPRSRRGSMLWPSRPVHSLGAFANSRQPPHRRQRFPMSCRSPIGSRPSASPRRTPSSAAMARTSAQRHVWRPSED